MTDPTQTTAPTMSSQEYLQQLREKRHNKTQEQSIDSTQTTASQAEKPTSDQAELFPGVPKPRPKRTILTWRAPSRPFKKRDRQYYLTVMLIVFLVSLILFFAGQFLPIAVVISVGFLAYVLSSVPPHQIVNEISTYGVKIEDELFYWEEMGRFWVEKKFDQEVIYVEIARFPGRLTLLFDPAQKEELEDLLSQVLMKEKPADTFFDKGAKWLQDNIPLEIK